MTPADIRAMPPLAQHAWRAVWLEVRLAEAAPQTRKAAPGEILAALRGRFSAGDAWRWTDLMNSLSEFNRESVKDGLRRLMTAGVIERVGHGVYRQARQ